MSDDASFSISRRRLIQATAAALAGTQSSLGRAPLALPEAAAEGAAPTAATMEVPAYLFARLAEHGVKILFGVPGATCDALFAAAEKAGVALARNTSDFEAGYAADGFARVRGLAAVSVTYGVGMRSLLGTIAGAHVERVPVVVINGGPSKDDLHLEREWGTLFSHSSGREQSELAIFREVTAFAARAEKASEVPRLVDQALTVALTAKRPVYIEIAKDVWDGHCAAPSGPLTIEPASLGDEQRLAATVLARLQAAKQPVLLLGVEIARYGLAAPVTEWVTKLRVPWATTLLGKSVIAEQTPGFIGVYGGEHSMPSVKATIERADLVLALGCVMGRQYRHLVTASKDRLVRVANDEVRIGKEVAGKAALGPLLAELGRSPWQAEVSLFERSKLPGLSFEQRRSSLPAAAAAQSSAEIGFSYDEAVSTISGFLDEGFVAVTDTSLSMYPAAELNVTGSGTFVCNAVWQAIGYSLGAAVGVALGQKRRPLVLTGDGGFQMTVQSLSTMVTHGLRAIVIVLDNGEYGIEQWLLDPDYFAGGSAPLKPYLALNRWNYVELAKALGLSFAAKAENGRELQRALAQARDATGPSLIAATIRPRDLPGELRSVKS